MNFQVHELRRAQADMVCIANWIAQRSPQGACAWLQAYEKLLKRLETDAATFPTAIESKDCEFDVRQAFFKTRRGRIYRALFHITGSDVYILRIRGPGQAPISPADLGPK